MGLPKKRSKNSRPGTGIRVQYPSQRKNYGRKRSQGDEDLDGEGERDDLELRLHTAEQSEADIDGQHKGRNRRCQPQSDAEYFRAQLKNARYS